MKRLSRSLTAVFATALLPLAATAQNSSIHSEKIARDLATADSSKPLPVIIRYKSTPGDVQDAHLAQSGGVLHSHLPSIQASVAHVPASALASLASDPNVAYISLDHPLAARQQVTVTSAEYTLEPINALPVWAAGYTGAGVGVAVIDSGINTVDDLYSAGKKASRVVYSASFVPGDSSTADAFGHGTHVAGLIAGNGTDSFGSNYFRLFAGVAPSANLINLRVLDGNGNGTDSSVIAAIEAAISLKSKYNIKVINLSLGRPIWESYQQDPLCQAAEQAWQAGIVVVAAAGNAGRDLNMNAEGYGTVEAPGNDPYVLTVGAMKTMGTPGIQDDLIASYSSKGPSFIDHISKPDLVAPGNLVVSLKYPADSLAVNNPSFITENAFYTYNGNTQASANYFPLSGTSMAAGVTSGAVALLMGAYPNLTPDQAKAFLMRDANKSTFPLTSSVTDPASGNVYNANYDVFTVGAGYLDINKTFQDVSGVRPKNYPVGTAMSPTAVYNSTTGATTLVGDQTILWGSTILWGAGAIYGQNEVVSSVNGQTILWGSTILWGASDPSGFSALNSSTILWGAGSPEAATILWGSSTGADSSTILWGSGINTSQTILWGSGVPYIEY